MWAILGSLSGCSVSSATTTSSHGTAALSCLQELANSPSHDLTSFSNLLHFRGGFQASLRSTTSLLPTSTLRGSQRCRNRKCLVMNVATEPKYDLLWWKGAGPINMREMHSQQEFVNAQRSAGEKLVVVIFFGTWCRSCRVLHPKLCKLAEDYGDVEFLKLQKLKNAIELHSSNHRGIGSPVRQKLHFLRTQQLVS
ncbi:hypothetical protein O6H91_07G102700 [Diphasiastrum complanatum]|uniref:Uncharacterized protein n=1 Tax=Diphasiastrum complanatum TaxID=34168 RepID=A0ACC2D831_DIPCM|nr:hypothetical protein O6H91_07G102700 [Diphasiastrum complanatum]